MKKALLIMGLILGVVSTQSLASPTDDHSEVPRYDCNGTPVWSPFFCDER